MAARHTYFEGIDLDQLKRIESSGDYLDKLEAAGLKRSIFSTSQSAILTYYFGSEQARDEAVRRWRKHGIEIIGQKENPIMSIEQAIRETIDYYDRRITVLQNEDRDMTERYDRMPEWAIKRQREIELEVNRLGEIQAVMRNHLNGQEELKIEPAKTTP